MPPESGKTGAESIIERLSDQEKSTIRDLQNFTDAVAFQYWVVSGAVISSNIKSKMKEFKDAVILQAATTLGEVQSIDEKELASLIESLKLTPSNIVTMNRLMGRVIDVYRYSHGFDVSSGTDPVEFLGEETRH